MQRSDGAIRTTHAGRLPPVSAERGNDAGSLTRQVAEVIRKQVQLGISCVGDGEFWNGRNFAYYAQQFSGITARALRLGYRIHEVPIRYYARSRAQGKKLTWLDGVRALGTLARLRLKSDDELFGRTADRDYHQRRQAELSRQHPLITRNRSESKP